MCLPTQELHPKRSTLFFGLQSQIVLGILLNYGYRRHFKLLVQFVFKFLSFVASQVPFSFVFLSVAFVNCIINGFVSCSHGCSRTLLLFCGSKDCPASFVFGPLPFHVSCSSQSFGGEVCDFARVVWKPLLWAVGEIDRSAHQRCSIATDQVCQVYNL